MEPPGRSCAHRMGALLLHPLIGAFLAAAAILYAAFVAKQAAGKFAEIARATGGDAVALRLWER